VSDEYTLPVPATSNRCDVSRHEVHNCQITSFIGMISNQTVRLEQEAKRIYRLRTQ